MGNLMWIIFIFLLAVLAVACIWLLLRLRTFSQAQHYTVMDDKLLQSMLGDEALSKKVKKELVRHASGEKIPVAEDGPVKSEKDLAKK
ncbi:MAG: hypothetical protein D3923_01655 [Candidatus Electrothrix sp. AR3]|nr:hypothetical protein [Candidatus Electrothrix sp. AR3]